MVAAGFTLDHETPAVQKTPSAVEKRIPGHDMDMDLTATVKKVLPNGNEDIRAVLKLPYTAAESKLLRPLRYCGRSERNSFLRWLFPDFSLTLYRSCGRRPSSFLGLVNG